jgi:hypothetical protein
MNERVEPIKTKDKIRMMNRRVTRAKVSRLPVDFICGSVSNTNNQPGQPNATTAHRRSLQ